MDIHRKPGYDPVELLLDPAIRVPALTVGWKLVRRKLGFRTLLDVIPLDATLVRGSHGRAGEASEDGPVLLTRHKEICDTPRIDSVDVFGLMLEHLTGERRASRASTN